MWFELVQGEGGFYAGQEVYFRTLMGILREHHVAIVMDEVQTFGRTSRVFAFQHFSLEGFADIVTVGKMLQVCATLFTDAFKPAGGLISQTFTGATASIHAARAILDESHFPRFFGPHGRNMQVHGRFVERFAGISAKHPSWLRGPFGLGGMIAFTPFNGTEVRTKRLLRELFDRGVIAFSTGANPNRVRMLPPIGVITDEQINAVCDILDAAMEAIGNQKEGA
jgi:4-aminobutyrate aminotransferase-like enzyme